MRRLLISVASVGAALALATPAAAQYYPQQPYNGYNRYQESARVQVQVLRSRIDRVERQIDYAARRGAIGYGTANRLRQEAIGLERYVNGAGRYGLNPYQVNDLQSRIARIEQRVEYAGRSYRGYGGYDGYNGYNGYNGYSGYSGYRGYGYDDGPLGDGVDDENN
jgi:hypothetical protein